MTVATIHEAKTHLSKYLQYIEDNIEKEIVIKKYNRPIARIIPYNLSKISLKKKQRKPGQLKGKGFWITEDFDAPIDDFDTPIFPSL